jgi:cytochrome P450
MQAALPAGPTSSALAQTVLYHRDPLGVLRRLRAHHGPVFTLRLALKGPVVFAADTDALGPLLESDPDTAHAGSARRHILPQASPTSPFGADGAWHREIRSRVAAGLAPDAMAAIEPAVAAIAREHVARWPVGRPFRLLARMRALCTDIMVRGVLAVADEPRATALAAAIRRMLWTPANPPLPLPGDGDGVLGIAGNALFARRRAPVARLLADEIDERRRRGVAGAGMLGKLVAADAGLDAEAIVDQLLVVLMAAQEPPAIALTNVVYELAHRPQLAERFVAEPDGLLRESVAAEALRLRPAAQAALRELTAPARIGGHALPVGTVVALPSLLLHRDPVAFPDPDAFDPGRFSHGPPPGAPYLPFGGGARRCVGEPLARAELRQIVPAVLERLRLRPAWPRPERMVVRGTVLVPHRAGLVRATAR